MQVAEPGIGAGARARLPVAVGVVQGALQPEGDRLVGGRVVQWQQRLVEKSRQPLAIRRGFRQRPVRVGGGDLLARARHQQPIEGVAQQVLRGAALRSGSGVRVRGIQVDAQQLYPLPVAHRGGERGHAQFTPGVVRVPAGDRRVGGVDHHIARRIVDHLRRAQIDAHHRAVGREAAHRQPQAARRRLDNRHYLLVVGRHQRAAPRVAAVERVRLAEHPLHAAVRRAVEAVPVHVHVVGEHLPCLALGVALVVQQQVGQKRGQRQHRAQVVAPERVHRTPFVVVAEHAHQLGAGRQRVPVVIVVQVVDLAHRGGALRNPLADLEQRGVVGYHPDPAQVLLAAPVGLGEEQAEVLAASACRLLELAHQQVVQRTGDQVAARRVEKSGGDEVVVLPLVDHDGALHLILVGTRAGGQGGGVVAFHHHRQRVGDVAAHAVDVEPLHQGSHRAGEPLPHRKAAVVEQHSVVPAPVTSVGRCARHQVAGIVEAAHGERLRDVVHAAVEVRDHVHHHLHVEFMRCLDQLAQAVVAAQARFHLDQALRGER